MKIQVFKVPATYFNHQLSIDSDNKVFLHDEAVVGTTGSDILAHTTAVAQFNNQEIQQARKIAEDSLDATAKKYNAIVQPKKGEAEEKFMERIKELGLEEKQIKVKTFVLQKILVK